MAFSALAFTNFIDERSFMQFSPPSKQSGERYANKFITTFEQCALTRDSSNK